MTILLVSRHPGTLERAMKNSIVFAPHCTHLHPALVEAGNTVIGLLPAHLAAEVCQRAGRCHNLPLDLPTDLRSCELDAATPYSCLARIEEPHIEKLS